MNLAARSGIPEGGPRLLRAAAGLALCAALAPGGCGIPPAGAGREAPDRAAARANDGAPPARAVRPESDASRQAAEIPSSTRLPPVPEGELDLETAIELALARNPDLRRARERIRRAVAGRKEATAAFLPILGTEAGWLWADAPSQFLFRRIDAGELPPGVDFNDPPTFDDFQAGVGLRYNLFAGGQNVLRRRIAGVDVDLRQLDRRATRNELVASVIAAYYDVLLAGELLQTARASVDTVRAQLRETRVKWREGRVLRSDVLSLEVRLAEARERAIRTENGRKLAVAALANLLGTGADTELRPAGEGAGIQPVPPDYASGLSEALERRPELARARARVERGELELASARRAFLPRLDARARVYWDDTDLGFEADRTNWLLGITATWDIFRGGQRVAAVEGARAALDELLEADRKATLSVELDVKRAYLALEESRARLEATEASVEQAEETLALVRRQYEGGAATVTRYLEAELDLTRARARRAQATYDLKKAQADAARGLGRFAGPGRTDEGSWATGRAPR